MRLEDLTHANHALYIHVNTQSNAYTITYLHTYIHTYTHTYIHSFIHTYTHTYTHVRRYIIHTCMHTHTYIHIHIYTASPAGLPLPTPPPPPLPISCPGTTTCRLYQYWQHDSRLDHTPPWGHSSNWMWEMFRETILKFTTSKQAGYFLEWQRGRSKSWTFSFHGTISIIVQFIIFLLKRRNSPWSSVWYEINGGEFIISDFLSKHWCSTYYICCIYYYYYYIVISIHFCLTPMC